MATKKKALKSKNKRKNKHLTASQRVHIESCLNNKASLRTIASTIGKDVATVSREIKRNMKVYPAKANDCLYKDQCKLTRLCGKGYCNKRCSVQCASKCMSICNKYEPAKCERLLEPPFVCNSCGGFNSCSLQRQAYRAKYAQDCYEERLVSSREGFDMTEEELIALNELVSPLLEKHQSPYHIKQSHPDKINMSLPTFYKVVDSGLLDVDNTALKQKVRRKPRKGSSRRRLHNETSTLTVAKVGRLYTDFLDFMEENDTFYVEMDCVEGKKEEAPALLTLHYPDYQMQIAMYLNRHDSKHVVDAFNEIETKLGTELFMEMFPVILSDNGPEFTDIPGMETSCLNPSIRRTRLFFCEPNRPDEKGSCENNHKLIRDVIPKGTSLLPYDQSDITVMMNHINSMRRKRSRGKSAYDRAMPDFPNSFFAKLGLTRVPDDDVTLSPKLLKDRIKARTKHIDYRPESRKRK